MRRIAVVGGFVVLAYAVATRSAVVWVDQSLAAAPRSPVLCMAQSDREKIAIGKFPKERRDVLVSKSLNFDKGVPHSMAWWHLRGAAIHMTYVTFWSPAKRGEVFNRLASAMRDCSRRNSMA